MIRPATHADLPRILEIYAPYILNTTYSFEYEVPTLEAFTARFEAISAQFPWLVWEEAGVILGYAYGSAPFDRAAYRWCAESSIYLVPQAQGRGIGKRLYVVLEELLRQQGYQTLYAIITSENEGSLAFHRRMGFAPCAQFPGCGFKFGRWLGVTWLEKRLFSGDFPSDFPVSWGSIVKNHRNFAAILAKMSLS